MKRTISAMVGKGSLNHNSREFYASNVDPNRSHLNIELCREDIRDVYHELFDDAQERFNAKQTRNDRHIDNYYEKICSSKQEKPFHEIVLQIGNKDDTGIHTELAETAKQCLIEYANGFQARNPTLRVFWSHLHMDEATPHVHIDFVPYITGSKRSMDTRVSLKQALAQLGFKGGTRSATEWNQWAQSEKQVLAEITSVLIGLQERLKETNKRIKNLMSAIEQGIITPTTKERLEELEEERRDFEGQIAREEMKKPLLTKERIMYWLESFKRGDIEDVEYQRRIIDTLVNSVYVYDDGDKGRKLVLTFNISGNNTLTISSSDIERTAPAMPL